MTRRTFITKFFLLAGTLKLAGLAGGCRLFNKARGVQSPREEPSTAELARALEQRRAATLGNLAKFPDAARKLQEYLEELRVRANATRSRAWLNYQNDRLRRINWLVDKRDDGRAAGIRLKMRPYDIPWLVWGIGKSATPEQRAEFGKKLTNGAPENTDKVMNAPDVEIEFTDRFADFCCLCVSLDTEGCKAHKEFAGYGTTFPQAVQISPQLRRESDAILRILGLKWDDVVTGRQLLELCARKAPDPAAFADFPLGKKEWDWYRAGIARLPMRAGS